MLEEEQKSELQTPEFESQKVDLVVNEEETIRLPCLLERWISEYWLSDLMYKCNMNLFNWSDLKVSPYYGKKMEESYLWETTSLIMYVSSCWVYKIQNKNSKGGRSSSLLWQKQTKPNRKKNFVSDLAEIWYASIRSQFHPPHQIWGQSEVVWIFKKDLFICKVYK